MQPKGNVPVKSGVFKMTTLVKDRIELSANILESLYKNHYVYVVSLNSMLMTFVMPGYMRFHI